MYQVLVQVAHLDEVPHHQHLVQVHLQVQVVHLDEVVYRHLHQVLLHHQVQVHHQVEVV
ncbi:MAG: hypothetical protein LBQ24_04725 [Candidatus Peribacteria bacterium]|nr:hypothetical protein [Candidatus Peribacteria bacterium]